jgi:2-phosphosulfolactate phosphatase
MQIEKPTLFTCLSPALLQLYEVKNAVVVVIDVFRATSTIATALYNGAQSVIPVDDVAKCIELGNCMNGVTAGERDGKIAEGLSYGNSPFEYPKSFIAGKTLVLTTTNGTRLLHMALARGASHIVTGSFPNLSSVCNYLVDQKQPVILACAGWKDRVNIEDLLFAGAVLSNVREHFVVNCDSSQIAESLYQLASEDVFEFIKSKDASHYHRLKNYGLEQDMKYCLTPDIADVLPFYENERLLVHSY